MQTLAGKEKNETPCQGGKTSSQIPNRILYSHPWESLVSDLVPFPSRSENVQLVKTEKRKKKRSDKDMKGERASHSPTTGQRRQLRVKQGNVNLSHVIDHHAWLGMWHGLHRHSVSA